METHRRNIPAFILKAVGMFPPILGCAGGGPAAGRHRWSRGTTIGVLLGLAALVEVKAAEPDRIRPYAGNPFYWEYRGKPVLLLGGSQEDNQFNHPENLAQHLDTLKRSGGNYIRNTMSSRDLGNPWAFRQLENGLYDLEQWNDEYWDRFDRFLKLCQERDIIVQVEVWDPWDYFASEAAQGFGPGNVGWESCPFNPRLNINYTAAESGLAEEIDYYSGSRPSRHRFFHTVPLLDDLPVARKYQEAFVDKLLSISLRYPNVLYCMNNEIGEPPAWGEYWADFIRDRARAAGREVYLADMRRNRNFQANEQVRLLHDRVRYDFFEISQNNANNGQQHYDMLLSIRSQVKDRPKPLNNVKVYGGKIGRWTTSVEEGIERFWRNLFGGSASVRFHRPGPSHHFFGLGLGDLARIHLRAARTFTDSFNLFTSEPRNDLLSDRQPNEAYCLAAPGRHYALYFPASGSVKLDVSTAAGPLEIRWFDIAKTAWQPSRRVGGGSTLALDAPDRGPWAVLVLPAGTRYE
jgi:hypothetical protein